jgi:hypothetical protein
VRTLSDVMRIDKLHETTHALGISCREWFGLAGAVVFLASAVAMMMQNGCPRGGETGFFFAEVW